MDINDLAGLLGQVRQMNQPTPEQLHAARMQGLVAMGLGLMGAPRGQEFQRLGQAGLLGLQTKDQYLQQQQRQTAQNMQEAAQAMQLQSMLQQRTDNEAARKIAMGLPPMGQPAGTPASIPAGPGVTTTPLAMPPLPQGVPASGAPTPPSTPFGLPSKASKYQRYSNLADQMMRAGLIDQAQKYSDLAEKFRPQLDTQKVLTTPDGKRVVVNVYKDGTSEVVPGLNPDLEKAVQVNNGKQIVAADPFNLQPIQGGGFYAMTTTPGEDLSASTTRRGQDLSHEVAEANLALARNADARAATNQGKPALVADLNGNFYAVNPETATGRPVTAENGEPLNKGQPPLTESQAKATVFANQMLAASNTLRKLEQNGFTGAGRLQQAELGMAGANGIPYVPGSAAIPRVLAPNVAQQYHQAEKQWVEGFLRFQSGATITPEELKQGVETYFPQQGNSDAVIAQKAAMRKQAEDNMRAAAGRAGAAQFLPRDESTPTPDVSKLMQKYAPR